MSKFKKKMDMKDGNGGGNMAKAGNYYYEQLNKEQQRVYFLFGDFFLQVLLLFHWRGGYLTREILSELLEIFNKEARAKDKRAYVSVNWSQAVLRVRFVDGTGEEQIEMEEANEGEKDAK